MQGKCSTSSSLKPELAKHITLHANGEPLIKRSIFNSSLLNDDIYQQASATVIIRPSFGQ